LCPGLDSVIGHVSSHSSVFPKYCRAQPTIDSHAPLGAATPPADERSTLTKAATGLHDRLNDMAEHPEEAVESEGEQGPQLGVWVSLFWPFGGRVPPTMASYSERARWALSADGSD
jgi:hypothetical protein